MKKVLIIDNDETSSLYYSRVLKNHSVTIIKDENEVTQKIAENKYDVIIINYYPGNNNDFNILKDLKIKNKNLKIVMVATYSEALKESLDIKCDSFYLKPISSQEIMAIVK